MAKVANKKKAYDMAVKEAPMHDDWRAQQDMRTLVDAEKIKKDKHRHSAACKHAKKELEAHKRILGSNK